MEYKYEKLTDKIYVCASSDHRFGTSFRGYWDYDSGGLGDMAQHYLDPLQYLLCKDETSPVKIDYKGLKQHPEAVGSFDRFTLTYADGSKITLSQPAASSTSTSASSQYNLVEKMMQRPTDALATAAKQSISVKV